MDGPVIYAIKDLTPFATAVIGLAGVAAGWMVTRRRNRVDKLRETWANLTASTFEAVERCSLRVQTEDDIRAHLKKLEADHGADVAERVKPDLAEALQLLQANAFKAVSCLRRDYCLLQLLENDSRALEPPASIINTLLADTVDKYRLNGIRALINQIALDNRWRFLCPWRRWHRWRHPRPLRDPALDAGRPCLQMVDLEASEQAPATQEGSPAPGDLSVHSPRSISCTPSQWRALCRLQSSWRAPGGPGSCGGGASRWFARGRG